MLDFRFRDIHRGTSEFSARKFDTVITKGIVESTYATYGTDGLKFDDVNFMSSS